MQQTKLLPDVSVAGGAVLSLEKHWGQLVQIPQSLPLHVLNPAAAPSQDNAHR